MLPAKKNKDIETIDDSDSDPDFKPNRHIQSPPPKCRRVTRSCRKRKGGPGQPKKTPDDKVKVEAALPEEVDQKNFQKEVINERLGFAEIGGLDETIELLRRRVILPIEHRQTMEKKYSFLPMKGIIFHGPPGTGKTLLAKAMAAELSRIGQNEFTFYYRKGPDLLSRYVGQSEENVKLIFDVAKANKPAIVFFDELDALCCKRSDHSDNRHETSLVCTILAQMDCITCGDILVIGATNRLESIDPAFRREGRFDTEILFSNPTHQGRKEILKVYSSKWEKVSHPSKKLLKDLAGRTAGFTGADLEGLCKDAMRCAIDRKIPEWALTDKEVIKKQLKDSQVLPMDWYKALRERGPTNTNIFGNQDFAGIQIDTSLEPVIGGIQNEMKEWIQRFWSPKITGFNFAVIWSKSEDFIEDIDNIIFPAALTSFISKNRRIIVMTEDKLEATEMTGIFDQAGKSSLSTLIYFPRIDIMDEHLKTVIVKSLKKYKILRLGKPAFAVIGSAALVHGANDLDGSLTKLLSIPPLIYEVRHPSDKEVKAFFTPTITIRGNEVTQRSLQKIVKTARGLDVTTLSDMRTEISKPGVNIDTLTRDFGRLFGQNPADGNANDSGNEDGSENYEDSEEDEGRESDSEVEE